jgi:hypothetical protein
MSATDVLERHGVSTTSFARGVQEVMLMNAQAVRRLLKDMFSEPVEAPDAVLSRLITGRLVQNELRFRIQNKGESLLPFSLADYREALEYAKSEEVGHRAVYEGGSDDSDGEETQKRGRSGGTFEVVKAFYLENRSMDPKDAAATLAKDHGLSENTAKVYFYKCRKMEKQGEL